MGTLLPMLIFADCFAITRYRRHAQWDKIWELIPWVALGMLGGAVLLWRLGEQSGEKDCLNLIIGALVLLMLTVHIARVIWGERMTPRSRWGAASTGAAAGFATTVSNAAGSIMTIYLTAMGLPKEQFMGTVAWYFFIFNLAKLPVYWLLTMINPGKPMITHASAMFDLTMIPMITVGALLGSWLLHKIPQKVFDTVVLALAAAAAIKLLLG